MAKFLNRFFISIAGFFLCFLWMSYAKQDLWVRYVFSCLIGTMLFCLLLSLEKTRNALPYKRNKKNTQALKYTLALMTEYDIFISCFEKQGIKCTKLNESCWLAEKNEKTLLTFYFRLNNIGVQDLINAYKQASKTKASKIILFCISVDPSLWRWQSNFPEGLTILDFNGSMNFLEEQGKRITPLFHPNKRKFFDKSFFYYAFSKKRYKQYLSVSLILIVTSFISFFPLYDIIMATVCLIASLYSLFNKRFNPQFNLPIL